MNDHRKLLTEWPIFRKKLIDDKYACSDREGLPTEPESYWSAILNNAQIPTPPTVRDLIMRLLITIPGSAEAERLELSLSFTHP